MTALLLVGMHLGALHPYEKVLTLVLAFGPFLVLGAVIAVRHRHEDDEEDGDEDLDGRNEAAEHPADPGQSAR
jgi:hypothetical protein